MPIRRVSLALGNDAKRPPFARWVGRGGLPTLPFVVCQRGPILLVSICDEIPSVAMTFTALGLQFCYVAVGGPEHLQATTRFLFSHCLVVPELNSFHFSHLPHVWKNAPFWSIVIVGREMPSIASRAIPVSMEVCRLAQEATELRKGLTSPCNVLAMVETCTPEVKAPKMVGPICTEAAHFGHISRPSFWWWFSTPECCAFPPNIAVPNVLCTMSEAGVVMEFRGKPCPKRIWFQDGFVKHSTQPFPCWPSLEHSTSQVLASMPLLEKRGTQRPPNPQDVAQMFCIPKAIAQLDMLRHVDFAKVAHGPCLALVVVSLLKLCQNALPSHIPSPWYEPRENAVRKMVAGTAFQPGVCENFPGIMTHRQVSHQALHRCALEGITFKRSESDLAAALAQVPLAALQVFWVQSQLDGRLAAVQGPEWAQQKAPGASSIAVGCQRGSGLSRFAVSPLHPPGLTKDEHIVASAQVPFPFSSDCVLDADLVFACRFMAIFGPLTRQWRLQQLRAMQKLAKVLRPWETECVDHMPPSVRAVAHTKKPMFMLICSLLLRWPDETNALRYVTGFQIVGDVEHSGLFRPLDVNCDLPTGKECLLGQSAEQNLAAMKRRVQSGLHDADLLSMTQQEISEGFAEGMFTEQQLNQKFGVGMWRPMERFIHVQSCGKLRCIDSGKKPGHNSASRESETIYTTTVDVVPAVVRHTCQLVQQFWATRGSHLPDWCDFVLGTEDMKNAYRQCPVHPHHRCCSCVAFWHPELQDVRFIVLNGLPFGLSSSVLNFNRTPALLTAMARGFCGCAVAHFFDDSGIIDLASGNGFAQAITREVHAKAGAQLDPGKSQAPAGCRTFLGLSINVAVAASEGVVEIDLKPGFREAVQADIESVFESSTLTSGQAAKLRGKFGWSASGTYGKCARGGQAPLVKRQYSDTSEILTNELRDSLQFHSLLALFVGPRQVQVLQAPLPPLRIYSDASYDLHADVVAGIGFVLFDAAASCPPIGMAGTLEPHVLGLFEQRHQQITPCEALLSVIVPHNLGSRMAGRDILWYIDNQAACQILTIGSSSQSDLCFISSLAHLLFARLNCRIFWGIHRI